MLRVWLALSGCSLCVQRRPERQQHLLIRPVWNWSFLTFLLGLWLSFPFISFFSSNSLDRWLSSVSHDEYWLLVSITSVGGDGIVPHEAFLSLSLPDLFTNSSSIYQRFFLAFYIKIPSKIIAWLRRQNLWFVLLKFVLKRTTQLSSDLK